MPEAIWAEPVKCCAKRFSTQRALQAHRKAHSHCQWCSLEASTQVLRVHCCPAHQGGRTKKDPAAARLQDEEVCSLGTDKDDRSLLNSQQERPTVNANSYSAPLYRRQDGSAFTVVQEAAVVPVSVEERFAGAQILWAQAKADIFDVAVPDAPIAKDALDSAVEEHVAENGQAHCQHVPHSQHP
eukprot:6212483-Pleurochrysis_carterae.AAC.4